MTRHNFWILILAMTAALNAQTHYRWTGAAGDGRWASTNNWLVQQNDQWRAAASPPGKDATIHLGDAPQDAPQTIILRGDVTVDGIAMQATGQRQYTLAAQDDQATLTLAGADPIEQHPDTTQQLILRIATALTQRGATRLNLQSEHAAPLLIDRPMRVTGKRSDGRLTIIGGTIALPASLEASRVYLDNDPTLLLAARDPAKPYRPIVASRGIFARGATLVIGSSAVLPQTLYPRGHIVHVRARDADAADLALHVAGLRHGGEVRMHHADGATASPFTLFIDDIGLEGRGQGSRIHLADHTAVDIARHQYPPLTVDQSAGIHGRGRLIKSRNKGRAATVTQIGDRNTCTGGTFIHAGGLQLTSTIIPVATDSDTNQPFAGRIGPGMLHIATGATFDLNGLDQTLAGVTNMAGDVIWPAATIKLNGGRLTINATRESKFDGRITGAGALVKQGPRTFQLSSSYTNAPGRLLRVEQGVFAVGGRLTVKDGTFELAGGHIEADAFNAAGQTLHITLPPDDPQQPLVRVRRGDLTATTLSLAIHEDRQPRGGDQYPLLASTERLAGVEADSLLGHRDGDVIDAAGGRWKIELHRNADGDRITLSLVGPVAPLSDDDQQRQVGP